MDKNGIYNIYHMARFDIPFVWYRDTAGYSLVGPDRRRYPVEKFERQDAEELFKRYRRLGKSLDYYKQLEAKRKKMDLRHIVGRGGKLEAYRPLENFETLYAIFAARVTSGEAALDFVSKFGYLGGEVLPDGTFSHPIDGAPVFMVLDEANRMRDVLNFSRLPEAWTFGTIKINLLTNPATGKLRLGLAPRSLRDALWLQLAEAQYAGSTVRECLHCGIPFKAGPGAGRRRDAKFCSEEHQIAFNSLKRSSGG
jgi:hypothetical protein